jgi:KipI family sensor histidine kinase inhibitor
MTMLRRPSTEISASGSASSPAPSHPRFIPVGDAALTIEFGNEVALELNDRVIALDIAIAAAELDGIVETVPSYRSLLVCYDPLEISYHQLIVALRGLLSHDATRQRKRSTGWNVPVLYEPPYCDDLPEVSQRLGLTEQQVIDIHTGAEFHVYTIGYAPGMPYLGGVPASLHLSRREVPRPQVAAGAVMIGGVQACIVPTTVPSAWYLLGQTPLRPFDLARPDPFLFRPGDRIRFRRASRAEFDRLSRLAFDDLLPLVRDPP